MPLATKGAQTNDEQISRRRALKGAGLVLGGVLASSGFRPAAAATRLKAVWKLTGGGGDGSCNACKGHKANKLYATKGAVRRAHRGCNCKKVKRFIPKATWRELFGPPSDPDRTMVDKRWPWVQSALKNQWRSPYN